MPPAVVLAAPRHVNIEPLGAKREAFYQQKLLLGPGDVPNCANTGRNFFLFCTAEVSADEWDRQRSSLTKVSLIVSSVSSERSVSSIEFSDSPFAIFLINSRWWPRS